MKKLSVAEWVESKSYWVVRFTENYKIANEVILSGTYKKKVNGKQKELTIDKDTDLVTVERLARKKL